jgi:hypothetical protein
MEEREVFLREPDLGKLLLKNPSCWSSCSSVSASLAETQSAGLGAFSFQKMSAPSFGVCRSRKRTILFAEHLTNEVLLKLPHRRFVFTMRKAFPRFLRHDRRLFAEVSRLIYNILREFCHEVAGRQLLTGTVIAHQTFGDMLRWNLDFNAIVLEGGFDEEGAFFYIPFSGLQSIVEVFRGNDYS